MACSRRSRSPRIPFWVRRTRRYGRSWNPARSSGLSCTVGCRRRRARASCVCEGEPRRRQPRQPLQRLCGPRARSTCRRLTAPDAWSGADCRPLHTPKTTVFLPKPTPSSVCITAHQQALRERASIIVTTNLAFGEWPSVFGEAAIIGWHAARIVRNEFRGNPVDSPLNLTNQEPPFDNADEGIADGVSPYKRGHPRAASPWTSPATAAAREPALVQTKY